VRVPEQRNTRQRAAIREAFERAGRPLSPQQALEAARADARGIGLATVYRNIRALVAEKWLAAIELPGAPAVYERAGKRHHHHFHCEECGGVFELSGCIPRLDRLAGRLAGRQFSVTRHELVLYGLCAGCKAGRR
jgi:Fur family ferric uptake transcriptional regulator